MAKLVDALDLGSCAAMRGGSIPFSPTIKKRVFDPLFYYCSLLSGLICIDRYCIEESVLRRADGAIILGNWLV